jgi:hypothetical protein
LSRGRIRPKNADRADFPLAKPPIWVGSELTLRDRVVKRENTGSDDDRVQEFCKTTLNRQSVPPLFTDSRISTDFTFLPVARSIPSATYPAEQWQ